MSEPHAHEWTDVKAGSLATRSQPFAFCTVCDVEVWADGTVRPGLRGEQPTAGDLEQLRATFAMTAARDHLAAILAEHMPATIIGGAKVSHCSCGWAAPDSESWPAFAAHVAEALLAAGVRTAEQVAQIEAGARAAALEAAAQTLDAATNEARSEVAALSGQGRDEAASEADLFAVAYRQGARTIRALARPEGGSDAD